MAGQPGACVVRGQTEPCWTAGWGGHGAGCRMEAPVRSTRTAWEDTAEHLPGASGFPKPREVRRSGTSHNETAPLRRRGSRGPRPPSGETTSRDSTPGAPFLPSDLRVCRTEIPRLPRRFGESGHEPSVTGRGLPPAPPAALRVAGSPTSGGSVLAGALSVLQTHVSPGGLRPPSWLPTASAVSSWGLGAISSQRSLPRRLYQS